jgi:hypothetical protein
MSPPVVLERLQRDILYDAVQLDLSGIAEIAMVLRASRSREAQELHAQYVDNSRLLGDLGWDRLDPRETYPLTVPAEALERTIRRLHRLAADSLEGQADVLRSSRDPEITAEEWADFRDRAKRCADEDLDLLAVCEEVLEAMGADPPRRRATRAARRGCLAA